MKVGIYHTLGDGGIEASLAALEGAVRGGATLLEVGLPFSDPLLDGPVVQASHTRALGHGTSPWETVCDALAELRRLADAAAKDTGRAPGDVAISVMTSAQLLYTDARRARLPPVDGLLVTDIGALAPCPFPLPSPRVWFLSQDVALGAASLVPPETVGMVYLTRLQGVTGAGQKASPETKDAVARIRAATKAPLWLGFGISERKDVLEAGTFGVDGVVIGSAFVRALEHEVAAADVATRASRSTGSGAAAAALDAVRTKAASWVKGVMPSLLACLVGAGAAGAAGALDPQGANTALAQEARRMGINYTVDLITQAAAFEPREERVNPNNVAGIPKASGLVQLRPDVKVDFGRRFALAARPRFAWDYSLVDSADSPLPGATRRTTRRTKLEARWQEVFGTVYAGESLSVTYGIQNYQWGSAESFSPTNILYPNPEFDRGLYIEQVGKEMVRVNLSAGQWGSLVILGKPERGTVARSTSGGQGNTGAGGGTGGGTTASPDAALVPSGTRKREGSIVVMKGEVSWNNGSDNAGLVVAGGDRRKPGFGETFSVNLTDALLLFGEAFHSREPQGLVVTDATVPVPNAPSGTPPQPVKLLGRTADDDVERLETVAVGGFRIGFAGGSEMRLEGLYNGFGLDRDELSDVYDTTEGATIIAARNAGVLLSASQEFLAEYAAFASARIVELPPSKALAFYTRATVFPADGSYVALASLEYAWKDDATLFGTYLNSDPREESFAMNFAEQAGTLGVKVTW